MLKKAGAILFLMIHENNNKLKTSRDSKEVCCEIKENQSASSAADVVKNQWLVVTHNVVSGRPTLWLLRAENLARAGEEVEIVSDFTESLLATVSVESLLGDLKEGEIAKVSVGGPGSNED